MLVLPHYIYIYIYVLYVRVDYCDQKLDKAQCRQCVLVESTLSKAVLINKIQFWLPNLTQTQ